LSRELRRAQERADKKQKKASQEKASQSSVIPKTSSSRQSAQEVKRKSSIFKPRWIIDTWNELRKVTWPSRKDIGHLTYVVVLVSIVFGVILGIADLFFKWFVKIVIL
jgi:preprotein translocase subunit SecE